MGPIDGANNGVPQSRSHGGALHNIQHRNEVCASHWDR